MKFAKWSAMAAVAASSVWLSSPVHAEGTKAADPVDAQFGMMDSNRDAKLSPDEHAVGAQKMFAQMDADKDGRVTAAEMDAAHKRVTGQESSRSQLSAAEKIKQVDSDADGVLTAQEHIAASKRMFVSMDANKDAFLSKDELAAGHAKLLKKASHAKPTK